VAIDPRNNLAGKVLFVPEWFRSHGPVFFKKDIENPKQVLLSTWDDENNREDILSADSWFENQKDRQDYLLFKKPIPPRALNGLGWSWSFAHQREGDILWHTNHEIDWKIARCFFVNATRAGSWLGANNLAVMRLKGYLSQKSPSFSVVMLRRSIRLSRGREGIPLRHLADCYRAGAGVGVDVAKADELIRAAEKVKK
jgi:hypothetical protein